MKSLFNLPEDLALKNFRYPSESWWYYGLVYKHNVGIPRYILYLLVFLLFFGGGMQAFIVPGYLRHIEKQDNLFTRIFDFDNVYSDILYVLRWSPVIVSGVIAILVFIAFIRFRKDKVYKFRSYIARYMMIMLFYSALMGLITVIAMSFHPVKSFDYYYAFLIIAIFAKIILSANRYKKKLYDAEGGGDHGQWMKFVPVLVALYPIYLFLRSVFRLSFQSDGNMIRGAILFVIALIYPYVLLIKTDAVVHRLLYLYLREHYIIKYPEAFRMQAGLSDREFYLGESSESEMPDMIESKEREEKPSTNRWWWRFQIGQGVLYLIVVVGSLVAYSSRTLSWMHIAGILYVYLIIVFLEYVLMRLVILIVGIIKGLRTVNK